MRLFKRKSKQQRLVPCPRCSQLLPDDALECDMCGLDLREHEPVRSRSADVSEALAERRTS
jgi:hypothetical protein